MRIPLPPTDKAAHFGGGYVIAHLAAIALGLWAAIPAAIALGVAKEWYDSKTGGDVSAWDAIATGMGGTVCFLVLLIHHL